MPEKLLRGLLTVLLKLAFRVEVRGAEHFEAVKDRPAVIIANHQSFLDPLLLAVFLPEKPAFAMNVFQARKWYFRPLLKLVDVFKVDPSQPMSTKSIIQRLRAGRKVVVFPEGRITTTGGIMKVYEGTGLIIDRTNALILPVRVEGAQYSKLARLQRKQRLRWFPKITLTLHAPQAMNLPAEARGRARRAMASARIYDMLTDAAFQAADWRTTILNALHATARRQGMGQVAVTDATQVKITYRGLFTKAFALSGALARLLPQRAGMEAVAVLLPTAPACLVTILALHMRGKVPALLNFSAGARNLLLACETGKVETVITSRVFVEKGKLEAVVEALAARCRIIYLEDLRGQIRLPQKLAAVARARFGALALTSLPAGRTQPHDPAVLLFTSGSEGVPKGVVLSHANMLCNIHQVASRISFTESDVMMNALPMFHSFGLTGGTLLPLILGFKVFLYPNPLHYRIIPECIYDVDATIMIGTDTFYNGYARYAHPFDFQSLRLAVSGAEKLKAATRQLYAEKFRVNMLEGYGVTETSPVIAVNTPVENRPGTVGRPLPGIECRLEKVEGLEKGARLYVKGPNVLLGYMKHDRPGELQPQGEWYDTGDIVEIDAQGFISILGRAKRFAKIGGEMVSLTAVEEIAAALWPDAAHAALAVPDARKGEQIVLLSEQADATREDILRYAQENGLPELMIPRRVSHMEALPRLGSGKIDYMSLKEMLG